jgi:hypothetical protein
VWSVITVIARQGAWLLRRRLLLPDWRAALDQRGELAGSVLKGAVAVGLPIAACPRI